MNNPIEQLNELLSNPDIQTEIKNVKDPEVLRQIFAQHGVEISKEELNELLIQIGEYLVENELYTEDGEITEKGLEQVAGGSISAAIAGLKITTTISGGNVLLGLAVFGAVCAVSAYVSYNRQKRK